jgi:hypothetical protein
MEVSMSARTLLIASLLPVAVACGSGDGGNLPTQPTTPESVPVPSPPSPVASDIAGEYRLTMTASSSCSFPPELERRIYTAKITEAQYRVEVALGGAEFEQGLDWFGGTRKDKAIDFEIFFGMGCGMGEVIDRTKLLYYEGKAHGTIAGNIIAGTFDGVMRLYEDRSQVFLPAARTVDCAAADHRIEFVRR